MTSVSASSNTRVWVDGKELRDPLPAYAHEELEHMRLVMGGFKMPTSKAAAEAKWEHIWDSINELLDPDYDNGWRLVGTQEERP